MTSGVTVKDVGSLRNREYDAGKRRGQGHTLHAAKRKVSLKDHNNQHETETEKPTSSIYREENQAEHNEYLRKMRKTDNSEAQLSI